MTDQTIAPLDDMDEIVGEFLVESHENLDQLDRDLVALEQDPTSSSLLASVFRTIHTIKGTSGFLAFSTLESVTHVGESLLARLRDGQLMLTPELTTLLLEVVDVVRGLLSEIEQTGAEGEETYDGLVARLTAALEGEQPADTGQAEQAVSAGLPEQADVGQASAAGLGERADAGRTPERSAGAGEGKQAGAGAAHAEQPATGGTDERLPTDPGRAERPAAGQAKKAAGKGKKPAVAPGQSGAQLELVEESEPTESTERRSVADSTIRVDVGLLDSLMNLVGELVLTRNQMLQSSAARDDAELARTTHRLNLVASELQEGVMKTRLQQIDTLWSKMPRVVRDLSMQLGKSVVLQMDGRETELDKTILEAVRDPLTHVVRNSIDHGIEAPEARTAAGKPVEGTLSMRAFHEGGQVNIEITDDGAGIDPARLREKAVAKGLLSPDDAVRLSDHEATNLVFTPGFSTASGVTNVSGRGVGMDVVRTNIERIGGSVDLTSEPGHGTTVRIRIPLTLAIIPALVVTAAGNRFAIPQVNLLELVRLDAAQAKTAIEDIHGAPVYRLRGRLLPLVDLRQQLELPTADLDPTYVVVLRADDQQYGLIVDDILDTEEIVVKPLGTQLRHLPLYAGATIMGDGTVALILDATAIARRAGMALEGTEAADVGTGEAAATDLTSVLVVDIGDGRRAGIPVSAVDRLEEIDRSRIERAGSHEVVQYRGQILPLVRLDHVLHGHGAHDELAPLHIVVCRQDDQRAGVVVAGILDIIDSDLATRTSLDSTGQSGSAVVDGRVTELVDIDLLFSGLPREGQLARSA